MYQPFLLLPLNSIFISGTIISINPIVCVAEPDKFVPSYVTAYKYLLLVVNVVLYVINTSLLFVLYHTFGSIVVVFISLHVLGVFPVPQLCTTTPLETVPDTCDLK